LALWYWTVTRFDACAYLWMYMCKNAVNGIELHHAHRPLKSTWNGFKRIIELECHFWNFFHRTSFTKINNGRIPFCIITSCSWNLTPGLLDWRFEKNRLGRVFRKGFFVVKKTYVLSKVHYHNSAMTTSHFEWSS
jgi:hypothetical protein